MNCQIVVSSPDTGINQYCGKIKNDTDGNFSLMYDEIPGDGLKCRVLINGDKNSIILKRSGDIKCRMKFCPGQNLPC